MSQAYKRAFQSRSSKTPTVVAVAATIVAFAAIPWLLKKNYEHTNLYQSDKPLTGSQIQRGTYLNTGSQDVGPDPDWNVQHYSWSGKHRSKEQEEVTLHRLRNEDLKERQS